DAGRGASGSDVAERLRDELVRMIIDGRRDVEAAEALAGLVAAEATTTSAVVDVLLDRVRAGGTPVTGRQRAVQALGELRGEYVRAVLDDLTADADPTVARIAGYLGRRLQEGGEAHDGGAASGR
ncbi:MAG TPA: hypothetical protein VK039_06320, partial [Brevibacterium sp.]|nr:hypothetical protein [Brevibacterium sp.]